ncbi:MAG: glycosyltransferase [Actinomycetota bacterium]
MSSSTTADRLDIGVYGARAIPSTYSGYETFLTLLLPALAERGHRVTMYCRTGELEDTGPYRGVDRVVLPAVPGKQFNTLSHGAVAGIVGRIRRHDVVLSVNVANALFCAFGRFTGQPTVLNTDGQEWLRGKWGRVGKSIFRGSAHLAKRTATGLVSDCQAMADIYAEEFDSSSTVIPYCFSSDAYPDDPEVLDELGVRARNFLVVAGRHNPENNLDRIASEFSATDIDMPLLVLGTANYESPVTERIEELSRSDARIRAIGHVGSRSAFLTLLREAAVYIHGHSVGGINPSLIEAMSSGADIVAFDTPFNREALSDTATYFTLGDDRFAGVLTDRLTADVATSKARREACVQRVDEVFDLDSVVSAYEDLLRVASTSGLRGGVSIHTRWAR